MQVNQFRLAMNNRLLWICAPSIVFLSSCSHEVPYQKALTPVTLYTVQAYSGESRPVYSGTVEPATRVDVAFRTGGYVEHLLTKGSNGLVNEGDFVQKGTVLARLRAKDYDIKISQANFQLELALAGLGQAQSAVLANDIGRNKAQADYERAGRLLKAESLTKVDYDASKAGYDSAEQNLAAAKAQVEMAKARVEGARAQITEAEYALGDSALTAPISGIVFKRFVEPNTLAAPGTPAFTIADTSSVKVIFGAPDMLLAKLKLGRRLDVTTDVYPEVRFSGRITRISPAADVKSRVFEVELTIPNPGNRLKAGMTASIEVDEKTVAVPVPVVPLTAIVRAGTGSSYSVFVAHSQGEDKTTVQERPVQLGDAHGNDISVVTGLKTGEKIVIFGATLIRDGETVRVVQSLQ